jgi:hypothetical protein
LQPQVPVFADVPIVLAAGAKRRRTAAPGGPLLGQGGQAGEAPGARPVEGLAAPGSASQVLQQNRPLLAVVQQRLICSIRQP